MKSDIVSTYTSRADEERLVTWSLQGKLQRSVVGHSRLAMRVSEFIGGLQAQWLFCFGFSHKVFEYLFENLPGPLRFLI